jgi:hypothetical protein
MNSLENMETRDKKEEIRIVPPDDLGKEALLHWYETVNILLSKQKLCEINVEDVNQLARLESERTGLMKTLGLVERNMDFIDLANPKKFDARFDELQAQFKLKLEAYMAVEAEYRKTFGKNKYSSYNSYRNARNERVNKRNARTLQ